MPQTPTLDARLRRFFAAFAPDAESGDPDGFGALFADPFLVADEGGARPVPRAAFLAALPRRAQLFAEAGLGPATLTDLTYQRLDDRYVLARTDWDAPRVDAGPPVRLASSYLLHDDGDRLRVVLYLNHQGLPAA
ncbi:nuclear transport factor 2 family protein [Micromonospora soli]|uniref:nuclear transport factor 2 family protein n=1 Tax=Micromonospora sp. NBRC 110009 TaxID=3061627 RepID=UPI0026730032|nr:nuclear transport factor 2 family protein [Micromonospora sp. NBRC 110009]WKT97329.1 nuclear transport factor 2 family protein [Micromonospora sp. NBRC 110009]